VLYGFKFFYLFMAVIGCTMNLSAIVDIADALLFIMAIPNLIGLYLLMPVVRREVNAYWAKLKAGQLPSNAEMESARG
jgi:AGCS family alanine or glycine:cation symporter